MTATSSRARRAAVVALVALAAAPAASAQQPTTGSLSYHAPRLPRLAAVQELVPLDADGDGLLDLALLATDLEAGTEDAWILRNRGDGGAAAFLQPKTSGADVHDLATLDWNADGVPDLALALSGGHVVVLLGDGAAGVAGELTLLTSVTTKFALAGGDLDGDGHDDLLISEQNPDRLRVLLGDGAGGVADGFSFPVDALVTLTELADLDGDGVLDLIAGTFEPGDARLKVLLGDGTGRFDPLLDQPLAGSVAEFAVADVDADGDLDLAARSVFASRVDLFLNPGDGALQFAGMISAGSASGMAWSDLDVDGHLDLLVSSPNAAVLRRFAGDGTGALVEVEPLEAGSSPQRLATLPLDGDGLQDLVVVDAAGGLTLFTGTGTGGLRRPLEQTAPTGLAGFDMGDLDGDGRLDAVVGQAFDDELLVFGGAGGERFHAPVGFAAGGPATDVALGDLDGDGRLDAVASLGQADGGVAVLLGDGAGGLGAPVFHPTGFNTVAVALADLDTDGALDALALDRGSARLSVLLGDGAGGFGEPASHPTSFQPEDFDLGDLDGDGRLDAVVIHSASTPADAIVLLGAPGGGFTPGKPVPELSQLSSVRLADVDLDGDLDLCIGRGISHVVRIHLNDGAAQFSLQHELDSPSAGGALEVFDADLDGEPDVLSAGPASVVLHRGRDLVGFRPPESYLARGGFNGSFGGVRAVDLEGGGAPDLMLASSAGRLSVLPHAGPPFFDVGGAAPGGGGPVLTLAGTLEPGSPLQLALADGPPGGTAFLVLGFDTALASLPGGTLVPAPDLLATLPLDASGTRELALTWPAGVPGGTPFWIQPWAAPPKLAGHALLGVTP